MISRNNALLPPLALRLSNEGLTLETAVPNLLRWLIYFIDLVVDNLV